MADKNAFLLDESGAATTGNKRPTHNPWVILCVLVIILSIVFGAAFVGGYFVGRSNATLDKEQSTTSLSQTYDRRAYRIFYDGRSQVVPAFLGNIRVKDFVQPRTVFVDGKLISSPGNPLLTPKGTTQLFVYQYEDEVSLVVTATGQNYGEKVDNASLIGEGQYTVTTKGLEGELIQLRDGYHQMYDRVPIPNTFSMPLQWGNAGSHGFIITLNNSKSVDAKLYFTDIIGTHQPLNIRGSYQYDIEIPDFPTRELPLRITEHTGELASQINVPESQTETTILGESRSSSGTVKLLQLNSNSRRRRSMATPATRGLAITLLKANSNYVLHRIDLFEEKRHGGRNGSLCWHIQNHLDRVEASFCALFHEALYDGLNYVPSDDAANSLLINSYYRDMDDQSKTAWNHVASLIHDYDSSKVIDKLRSRNTRSLTSFFSNLAVEEPFVINSIANDQNIISSQQKHMGVISNSLSSIVKALQQSQLLSNSLHRRRLLWSWKCGWSDLLSQGYDCLKNGVSCASNLYDENYSLGNVKECGSSIGTCSGFVSSCF